MNNPHLAKSALAIKEHQRARPAPVRSDQGRPENRRMCMNWLEIEYLGQTATVLKLNGASSPFDISWKDVFCLAFYFK